MEATLEHNGIQYGRDRLVKLLAELAFEDLRKLSPHERSELVKNLPRATIANALAGAVRPDDVDKTMGNSPSPEEIRHECELIQLTWSKHERAARAGKVRGVPGWIPPGAKAPRF